MFSNSSLLHTYARVHHDINLRAHICTHTHSEKYKCIIYPHVTSHCSDEP